jgi:hypothetical protein
MYGDTADEATPREIRRQGTMHHWPRGVDKDWSMVPNRIEGGRFTLPRYRDIAKTDWILQKWFAAWMWGTREDWASHRAEDGVTPLFVQEYPAHGDYFLMAGPWSSLDQAGDVTLAVTAFLKRERAKSRNFESAVAAMMAEEKEERAGQLEWLEREIMRAEQAMDPVWKSTSTTAQKAREQAAAAVNLTGHFGAGEDWG